jgi:hypothetical protein
MQENLNNKHKHELTINTVAEYPLDNSLAALVIGL